MHINNLFSFLPITDPSSALMITLVALMCFLSTLGTTIYLHRARTHRSIKLAKGVEHFFGFILFLNTGIPPEYWRLAHRHHHTHSDDATDIQSPHNPLQIGFIKMRGPIVPLIRYFMLLIPPKGDLKRRINIELKRNHDDWFSRTIYHKFSFIGPMILCITYLLLFGYHGIWMFLIQFLYLPVVAGMIINGFGHGSRKPNPERPNDHAINIFGFINRLPKYAYWLLFPLWFGIIFSLNILTGGEFRHKTHHLYQDSAKIAESNQLDIGWIVIYVLKKLGLARDIRYYKQDEKLLLS